jgi:hypothetical protein
VEIESKKIALSQIIFALSLSHHINNHNPQQEQKLVGDVFRKNPK